MKRRLLSTVICGVLMSLLMLSALADSTEYELKKLGMTVSMPSEYYVYTRESLSAAPYLDPFNSSDDEVLDRMKEGNVYLVGWNTSLDRQLFISMTDASYKDFNLVSDEEMESIAAAIGKSLSAEMATITEWKTYNNSQAKFLKIYISQRVGNETFFALQFYTTYGDKEYAVTLYSYSGRISTDDELTMKRVVDSIVFDMDPETAQAQSTRGALDVAADIAVSVVATVVIYSLPIIIYRFLVAKAPVERKRAKKITAIYGVCAFLVMSALIFVLQNGGAAGGSIIFWSFVNYRILIGGGKKPGAEAPACAGDNAAQGTPPEVSAPETVQPGCEPCAQMPQPARVAQSASEVRFCRKCGSRLLPDSVFCSFCGARVSEEKK